MLYGVEICVGLLWMITVVSGQRCWMFFFDFLLFWFFVVVQNGPLQANITTKLGKREAHDEWLVECNHVAFQSTPSWAKHVTYCNFVFFLVVVAPHIAMFWRVICARKYCPCFFIEYFNKYLMVVLQIHTQNGFFTQNHSGFLHKTPHFTSIIPTKSSQLSPTSFIFNNTFQLIQSWSLNTHIILLNNDLFLQKQDFTFFFFDQNIPHLPVSSAPPIKKPNSPPTTHNVHPIRCTPLCIIRCSNESRGVDPRQNGARPQ